MRSNASRKQSARDRGRERHQINFVEIDRRTSATQMSWVQNEAEILVIGAEFV